MVYVGGGWSRSFAAVTQSDMSPIISLPLTSPQYSLVTVDHSLVAAGRRLLLWQDPLVVVVLQMKPVSAVHTVVPHVHVPLFVAEPSVMLHAAGILQMQGRMEEHFVVDEVLPLK